MKDIAYKIVKDTNAQALLVQFPDLISSSTKNKLVVKFNHSIFIPIIAFYKQQAIGLSITTINSDNTAELISVFVDEDFRKQGVAVQLLQLTEKILSKNKIEHIQTNYIDKLKHFTAFEQLLKKSEWLTPQKVVLNMKVDNTASLKNQWVNEALSLSTDLTIFDWKDLTKEDEREIQNIITHQKFPNYLTPFQSEKRLDKSSSKGIRENGKIIGWCILHRINKQTNECSALYVSDAHRGNLIAESLMANAIKSMNKSGVDFTIYQANYKNRILRKYLTILFSNNNCTLNKAYTLISKKIIN